MAQLITIYINGNIYTVNKKQPRVEAFAVDHTGRIICVGNNDDVLNAYQEKATEVVDLEGNFVMPGIHDAHTHLLAAAMQQLHEVPIGADCTEQTIGPTLRDQCQCLQAHNTDDWLIANFYNGSQFPNGKADRQYLDELFPSRPVVVRDISCHNVLANTEALKQAGYDLENEQAPFAGELVRRDDGTLTGELVEQANTKLWLNMPTTPADVAQEAIEFALRKNSEWGITSCQEASANTIFLTATQNLDQANKVTCNIFTHIVYGPVGFARESEESLQRLIDKAEHYKTAHVATNFVKFWLDGAPIAPHFTQCNLDDHGKPQPKNLVLPPGFFERGLRDADARGFTCKIHCAGDGSARLALDAIQDIRATNPSGPRHELAHCNNVHPADHARFQPLRVTAEMSPALFHLDDLIAASDSQMQWPFTELLSHGTHMTIGSDWFLPLTPNLFPALGAVVPRIGIDAVIRAITLSGAEAVERAQEFGSIELGKMASFIMLDRDITTCAASELGETLVSKTWFEGKLVWDRQTKT